MEFDLLTGNYITEKQGLIQNLLTVKIRLVET